MSQIMRELNEKNIFLMDEDHLSKEQRTFVMDFFEKEVRHKIFPIMVDMRYKLPELKDKTLYLAVEMYKKQKENLKKKYSIIEIPPK